VAPVCFFSLAQGLSAQNLVVNGDFSLGNTGFASDYTFTTINSSEGEYNVSANPNAWNLAFLSPPAWYDHSPSADNFSLLVNGATVAGRDVWREAFAGLTPNTNLQLSGWASDLYPYDYTQTGVHSLLQFFVNGVGVGSQYTVAFGVPNWQQFGATWNTGTNTTATISIRDADLDAFPNDFALDDVSIAVPEPASLSLLALAGGTLLLRRRHNEARGGCSA
jgi:hypothetical protein